MRVRALRRGGETFNVPLNPCVRMLTLFWVLISSGIALGVHGTYHDVLTATNNFQSLLLWTFICAVLVLIVLPLQMNEDIKLSLLLFIWTTGLVATIEGDPWPIFRIPDDLVLHAANTSSISNSSDPAVIEAALPDKRREWIYFPEVGIVVFVEEPRRLRSDFTFTLLVIFWVLEFLLFLKAVTIYARRWYMRCTSVHRFLRLWRVQRLHEEAGGFEYWIWWKTPWMQLSERLPLLPKIQRGAFNYCGEVDGLGRPHGRGRWTDTDPLGECLDGHWREGEPIGPFQAHESGSGFRFHCVLVGACANRAEEFGVVGGKKPSRGDEDCAQWTVVSVECSVSGQFFTCLPEMRYVSGPTRTADAAWALSRIRHIDDDARQLQQVGVSISGGELHVDGHVCASPSQNTSATVRLVEGDANRFSLDRYGVEGFVSFRGSSDAARETFVFGGLPSQLVIDGWRPISSGAVGCEAVVYVHGCNCSTRNACTVLGQLFAMGAFPAHIKPLVYSWPSGTILGYYHAVQMSEADDAHADFESFIRSLIAAGVSCVHLIAHSMGGRFLCHAIHKVAHLFTLADNAHGTWRGTEASAGQEDPSGQQTSSAQEEPAQSECAGQKASAGQIVALRSFTLLHAEADLDRFLVTDFPVIRSRCPTVTLYTDRADVAIASAEHLLFRFKCAMAFTGGPWRCGRSCHTDYPNYRSIGLHPDCLLKPCGAPLDMDVVDISWMDHNVDSRHNFFTKNYWMVSDLRSIIVEGVRARLRTSRLVLRGGNMYSFVAAPSQVS